MNNKLISPLILLENDWFKNSKELNLSYLFENHLEEYFNMIYYFYEQGLLCDFLFTEISRKNTLTKVNNISFNTYMRNAESNKNIEIIIVDDGSTDKCGSICDEYKLKDEYK